MQQECVSHVSDNLISDDIRMVIRIALHIGIC